MSISVDQLAIMLRITSAEAQQMVYGGRADKKSKYGNRRCELDGIKFDSIKERDRYSTLKLLERAGVVSKIELQPRFVLQEAYVDREGKRVRKIEYVADFRVEYSDGHVEVEDVKGMKTAVYKLKKKLFKFKFQEIIFKEVY